MLDGYILVEGPTEFNFVKDVMNPYLQGMGIQLRAIPFGGYPKYQILAKQIKSYVYRTDVPFVTTMFDFYRLPADYPGRASLPQGNSTLQVEHIERSFAGDIDARNFVPYIALHEFEALIFTDPDQIASLFDAKGLAPKLTKIRRKYTSPEEIDDQTPPSRYLIDAVAKYPKSLQYQKTLHGPLIAQAVGLDRIRAECPHFNQWLERLESFAQSS
jgi:hypothetical protein